MDNCSRNRRRTGPPDFETRPLSYAGVPARTLAVNPLLGTSEQICQQRILGVQQIFLCFNNPAPGGFHGIRRYLIATVHCSHLARCACCVAMSRRRVRYIIRPWFSSRNTSPGV